MRMRPAPASSTACSEPAARAGCARCARRRRATCTTRRRPRRRATHNAPPRRARSARVLRAARHANTRQTSAYMSHAAREPASRIGTAGTRTRRSSPRQPKRVVRGDEHERRQHREHRTELEIARAENAGQALARHRAAEAVAGQDLHPRIDQPEHDERRRRRRRCAARSRVAQREAANIANGRKRKRYATVDHVLAGATAAGAEISAGSQ